MKKLLITVLSALICVNAFAAPGDILPGSIPENSPNTSSQDAYYVNITNQDTVDVFLTMFIGDGIHPLVAYGNPYQRIGTGDWHVGFNPPYKFIRMQVACYPGGPTKTWQDRQAGERFVIPNGICSAATQGQ